MTTLRNAFWSVENLITNSNLHTRGSNGATMAVQHKQDTKTA